MEAKSQINNIYTDMDVYDVDDNHIGEVRYVFFGSDNPLGQLPEDAYTKAHLIEAMGGDKPFPVPVLSRLYHHGFVRVGRWFFQPDLFIIPEQVADVIGNNVYLNCSISELMRG